MTTIVSEFLNLEEAEEAITEIWMSVERHHLQPPALRLEFDESGRKLRVHLEVPDAVLEHGLMLLLARFGPPIAGLAHSEDGRLTEMH